LEPKLTFTYSLPELFSPFACVHYAFVTVQRESEYDVSFLKKNIGDDGEIGLRLSIGF